MTDIERPRREQQREQTRQELLDAAAAVFARKGYHAASVDDVAEAAGFTKGAVYSNFDSKEDLFLALYRRHVDRAIGMGEQVIQAAPEDRGEAMARSREEMGVWSREWHLLETEFLLYAARNESMRELVAQHFQSTREQTAALVRVHLEDVGADADEDIDIARLLIGALDGLARASLIEGEDHGHLVGRLINLITVGLRAERGAATDDQAA